MDIHYDKSSHEDGFLKKKQEKNDSEAPRDKILEKRYITI